MNNINPVKMGIATRMSFSHHHCDVYVSNLQYKEYCLEYKSNHENGNRRQDVIFHRQSFLRF